MLPFADQYGIRVVLLNRRDYPEATPFDEQEKTELASSWTSGQEGADEIRKIAKDRAKEIYNFLESFVASNDISKEGGITVVGWSLGVMFMNMLLAYGPTFAVGKIDVTSYIKGVVCYGTHL